MDFGSYPPEVNSARMYTGPGAGPLTVAAQAWTTLAGELQSTAKSYRSVIAGLTSSAWTGPSSESMSTAAESFEQWLYATAAAAEETGAQARSASAAYQTAFAATVPPPVIAQNRSLLAALIATDLLGRNTHAIAATEAQYAEMWAQDSAAMSSYAATSATVTRLTAFTPPQPTTTGDSAQSAAVGQAAGTAAGDAQSTIQQAFSAVPSALQAAAAAPSLTDTLDTISNLISIFVDLPANLAEFTVDIPLGTLGIVSLPLDVVGALTGLHTDDIVSGWNGEQGWPGTDPAPVKPFPAPLLNLPSGSMPTPKTVAAGLGDADRVGQLAVPPTWTVSTPAVKPMSVTLPALPAVAAGETPPRPSGGALSEMALAGMAGRAMAGSVGGAAAQAPRPRATAPSPPDSPAPDKPRAVTTGVAAELREFTKLRDEGILTEDEYVEQKNRLLGR